MKPAVGIIICTRNRADSLRKTLEAIGACHVPSDLPAELCVVDNGSTDQTPQVAQSARLPTMPVRYLLETRVGKGYAYNRALADAAADIFLFTDDDVIPPKNWIEGMCRPIHAGQAEVVAGAVAIAPDLVRPWMQPIHRAVLAESAGGSLVGANMAFSRRVLEKVPAFDVELGPGALGLADETLFGSQLRAAGYTVLPAPDVAVEHHFDPSRLSHPAFLDAARKLGRSEAYVAYHWEHKNLPNPWRRSIKARLRLVIGRWKRMSECRRDQGISEWEFARAREAAFLRQYCLESKRPPNYAQRGLIKLDLSSRSR